MEPRPTGLVLRQRPQVARLTLEIVACVGDRTNCLPRRTSRVAHHVPTPSLPLIPEENGQAVGSLAGHKHQTFYAGGQTAWVDEVVVLERLSDAASDGN